MTYQKNHLGSSSDVFGLIGSGLSSIGGAASSYFDSEGQKASAKALENVAKIQASGGSGGTEDGGMSTTTMLLLGGGAVLLIGTVLLVSKKK